MYYGVSINEYQNEDVPSLKRLWAETFGDTPSLIDRFFELLPSMGTGLVAECGGELLGAAYVLVAELWRTEKPPLKLGYIYAVAVEPTARCNGIGARLVSACQRYCWQNGIDICATLPSENSLYGWYKKVGGLSPVGRCSYETVLPSEADAEISEFFADEYAFRRSDILHGKNYVNFNYGYMLFQEALCKTYRGGMFACGGGIACGYIDNGVLLIKEVLNDTPEFIPVLCRKLGAKSALVRRSAPDGEPFIAAYGAEAFPTDTVWNLALD